MLTLSIDLLSRTDSVTSLLEEIETMDGIHYVKIVAREI